MEGTWWGVKAIAEAPGHSVWATGARQITYRRLRAEVEAIQEVLSAHGIGAGSVVALQVPSSFDLLWWLFALWSNGAQVLLLDARMKPAETAAVLDRVKPQLHVTSGTAPEPLTVFSDECADVRITRLHGGQPGDPDIALVMCSSGSTAAPKIVVRTGASLLADVDRHAANPGMPTAGERVLLLSPATHGFGLAAGVLLCLRVGASLVLPGRLHPDELLRRARDQEVDAILGVPVHFDLLTRAIEDIRLPSLRLALSSGDVLSGTVRDNFTRRFGVPLGQGYGMAEVGAIAVDLTGDHTFPAVGRVLPGVRVRITDGELFVKTDRSPYLHLDNPDRYADGWLRTYDRAEIDTETGVLKLLGRADSLCVIGGLKVDLTEIEAVLRDHPRVTDALAACHTSDSGAPVLAAYVAGTATGAELTTWCQERLSAFKIPRRWHIGPDLPRTALGKTTRYALPVAP